MHAPVHGLIFDMDGTIVDNMRFHDDAWEVWHREYGLPFDRAGFFARTAGRTNPEILGELFPDLPPEEIIRRGEEKEAAYRSLYAAHVRPMTGLEALLDAADANGIAMAVGTAAPPDNIAVVLDTLGLRPRFRTIVSPSQGFRGKPHPDMFLAAAERMGIAPEICIVFEDAPLGVEAARRAGMRAVAVETMLDASAFAAFDNVVATLRDFTAALPLLGPRG
ncbi:MAG: beta-phosphoglucomutase family hydrolase [Beijerinckiaceae bacterium]|nr:beta-phosphoglucomutase family hydrolase [Beijerinckiaceae bacterium]MCZ8300543.1 beta-phosphoglucomutase family hydrolase [Beijerinckiaceae bacterium]